MSSTVNAIVGQRIVRRICIHCKESYAPPPQLLIEVKQVLGNLFPANNSGKFFRGKGCPECGNLGYMGRIGIFEVLNASEKISRIILESNDDQKIEDEAVAEGMITLKQDGYLKVLLGETTMEEVLRVAQD